MIRVKFEVSKKIESATTTGNEFQVELKAVTDGSDENKEFFKYTPKGNLKLSILGPEAADRFVVGDEYYLDITPCDENLAAPDKK